MHKHVALCMKQPTRIISHIKTIQYQDIEKKKRPSNKLNSAIDCM